MPRHGKDTIMRKKLFCEEDVFGFIWENADHEGMWDGDAAILAEEFHVTEDAAYRVISELTDRNRIQRIGDATYIITRWRERDDPGEEELL
jgi:hypothetical protein